MSHPPHFGVKQENDAHAISSTSSALADAHSDAFELERLRLHVDGSPSTSHLVLPYLPDDDGQHPAHQGRWFGPAYSAHMPFDIHHHHPDQTLPTHHQPPLHSFVTPPEAHHLPAFRPTLDVVPYESYTVRMDGYVGGEHVLPEVSESSREFMLRIARKMRRNESEILPYVVRLEREWLLHKDQLSCLDQEAVAARLGIPPDIAQAICGELSSPAGEAPSIQRHQIDLRPKQQDASVSLTRSHSQEKEEKDEGTSGTGRKRKRLTHSEWVAKVEQFAAETKHDPSPFRVASIYQVECYCCGYAVNMNKPGQLYYLKRHVEGVRPDMRISNHYKNYKRWRQQYPAGEAVNLTPDKLTSPLKRSKSIDNEEEEEEEESSHDVQSEALRRIRSDSPRRSRSIQLSETEVIGQYSSGEMDSVGDVEGEGSLRLLTPDVGAAYRVHALPHPQSLLARPHDSMSSEGATTHLTHLHPYSPHHHSYHQYPHHYAGTHPHQMNPHLATPTGLSHGYMPHQSQPYYSQPLPQFPSQARPMYHPPPSSLFGSPPTIRFNARRDQSKERTTPGDERTS